MDTDGSVAKSGVDPIERRDGFTALYDAHVGEVYRFVNRLCGNAAVAEDVTQDVFMTAVRTMDDPADVSVGWLMRVARNRLFDLLRRQSRYTGKLRLVQAGTERHTEDADVVDQLRVREALETLETSDRLLLTLHYVEGLTVAQLADEIDRSPKTVEGRLTRARRKLREALEASDG